jgi:hypothetical protein
MKGALSLSGSDIQIIHVIFKGLVITADFGKVYGNFTSKDMSCSWAPILICLTITGQCRSELIGFKKIWHLVA